MFDRGGEVGGVTWYRGIWGWSLGFCPSGALRGFGIRRGDWKDLGFLMG